MLNVGDKVISTERLYSGERHRWYPSGTVCMLIRWDAPSRGWDLRVENDPKGTMLYGCGDTSIRPLNPLDVLTVRLGV